MPVSLLGNERGLLSLEGGAGGDGAADVGDTMPDTSRGPHFRTRDHDGGEEQRPRSQHLKFSYV